MDARCALVTGASGGIGAAIVQSLLGTGYHVISFARRPGPESAGVTSFRVDLTNAEETHAAAVEAAHRFPITTVIHNAGAVRERSLEDVTPEDFALLAQLHLASAITLVQANLAAMKSRHFGRIVLVSTRAVLGLAKRTVYSATKAGMLGLARTWALELAAHGITVNVVAPGPIAETEMFHEVIPEGSPKLARIVESIPVRRLGRPQDVARAVLFFTSAEASFVTGQTLFVCGGTSVGSIAY